MRYSISIIFTILLLITPKVFSCTCIGEQSVKEAIKSADVVIIGKVVSKKTIMIIDSSMKEYFHDTINPKYYCIKMYYSKVLFALESKYKGRFNNDTITIYTGVGSGDCGFNFQEKEKYIVYGTRKLRNTLLPKDKNTIWTNICSRTKKYEQEELEEIEKYKKSKI